MFEILFLNGDLIQIPCRRRP